MHKGRCINLQVMLRQASALSPSDLARRPSDCVAQVEWLCTSARDYVPRRARAGCNCASYSKLLHVLDEGRRISRPMYMYAVHCSNKPETGNYQVCTRPHSAVAAHGGVEDGGAALPSAGLRQQRSTQRAGVGT